MTPNDPVTDFFAAEDHAERAEVFDALEAKARGQVMERKVSAVVFAITVLVVGLIAWPGDESSAEAAAEAQSTRKAAPQTVAQSNAKRSAAVETKAAEPKVAQAPDPKAAPLAEPKDSDPTPSPPSPPVAALSSPTSATPLVRPVGDDLSMAHQLGRSPRLTAMLTRFAQEENAVGEAALPVADDAGERAVDEVLSPGALAEAKEALAAGAFERTLKHLKGLEDHLEAQVLSGQALFELGKDAEALAMLDRARETRPDHPKVLLLSGALLQSTGETERAKAAYKTFLEAHSAAPEAKEIRAILASM